jgi:hypothetical protein
MLRSKGLINTMQYFTSASRSGNVRYGAVHWRVGVNDSPASPQQIGEASEVGITPDGQAKWRVRVHGAELPGLWLIIDGQFVPVEEALG